MTETLWDLPEMPRGAGGVRARCLKAAEGKVKLLPVCSPQRQSRQRQVTPVMLTDGRALKAGQS